MISFFVPGVPIAQGNHRVSKHGHIYDSAKGLQAWREAVAWCARKAHRAPPIEGPVEMLAFFLMPVPKGAPKTRRLWATKRPDLTKLLRAAEDAITGIVIADDSQIVVLRAGKGLAYGNEPGAKISIVAYNPDSQPGELPSAW